ncbi:MAG: DUF559 domain-containing protein [Planctomycetota bacterium]
MGRRQVERGRGLRRAETSAEARLWSLLRARQLSGLKFRRQHPIDGYFADFACIEKQLVVELDGASHDGKGADDLFRETRLRELGWRVIRFENDDVFKDVDAVLVARCRAAGVAHEVQRRKGRGDGAATFFSPQD